MRKLASLLALIAILGAAFSWAAPAFAEQPEEKVGSFVAVAHMDIWKHADGHWQKGLYNGKENVTEEAEYDPKALGINTIGYRLTRVTLAYPFGEDEYKAAGGRYNLTWEQFRDYYERRAVIHEVKLKSFDAATGRAVVEWRFDLNTGGSEKPWPLTDPEIRRQLRIKPPPGFEDSVEGYRYELPVIITWYGVKRLAPNFSVELDPGCPKDEQGSYVAEAGKTYTATVKFRAGDPVAGQDSPPYDVVVAGVHQLAGNRFYPASLRYVSGDGKISSQQGLEPEIPEDVTVHLVTFNRENAEVVAEFSWTARADTKQLAAVINYKWPRTDPLPYTMTFYREGEAGDQYGDNVAVVPIKVLAPPDLYVKSLNPGTSEVEQGRKYAATVVYGLKNTVSGPVQAKLELTHNGYSVSGVDGQLVTFSPGEEKSFGFNFTGQAQDSVLIAKIRPMEGDDADWSNNSKQVVVPLKKEDGAPDQPGSLTFQAVSQTRSKARPAGTAKWTDWVTATLRPPTPDPPRSDAWIEDWWIESASLAYPKKNPNFTIGCPYPPSGTRTVSMKVVDKHTAKVEFREDWALDGAPVYCLLEGRLMAEEPKYYTITARYTVGYVYAWLERRTGSYTVCDSKGKCTTHSYTYYVKRTAQGSDSGTVTGRLLVNGTGVDSRAQ